jgi:uncharacterized protein
MAAGGNARDYPIAIPSSLGALVLFFAITFAISWGIGGLCVAAFGSPGYVIGKSTTNPLFFLFFAFAPSFSAFATIAITRELGAARDLLRRMVLWRVGLKWYAIVIFGVIAIRMLQGAVIALSGASPFGALNLPWLVQQPIGYLIAGLIGQILGGPLAEEPGWRGYALPRMLARMNPLPAAITLGVIWGFWHLPLFFMPGVNQFHMHFASFLLQVITLSTLMTWVFINTRGSVLIAILIHLLTNLLGDLEHLLAGALVELVGVIVIVAAGGLSASAIARRDGASISAPQPTESRAV